MKSATVLQVALTRSRAYRHLHQLLLCGRRLLADLLGFLLDGRGVGLQAELWRLGRGPITVSPSQRFPPQHCMVNAAALTTVGPRLDYRCIKKI